MSGEGVENRAVPHVLRKKVASGGNIVSDIFSMATAS
jgi:hypothetical protein